jgi:hypothetical protein
MKTMESVRKKIIKEAARIYAANLIFNALGTGADSDLFREGEKELMAAELEKIANRIIPNIQAGTLDDCLLIAMAS